ncbi:MAG TPA: hypothetical protein VKB03_03350 [Conexibacter sp.]|nr:hypothetical protein [Conexibacter sp.]
MRRAALIGFLVLAFAGPAIITVAGASRERTLAFTLGAPSTTPAVVLRPGATVCQGPIAVAAAFDGVELQPGTFGAAGSPLAVDVRRMSDGGTIAHGRLAAGYADVRRETIRVGPVAEDDEVAVCIRNAGSHRTALYGSADAAVRTSTAMLDGELTGRDLDLVFRTNARSTLALVPDVLQRMALFRGGWIGTWLYWVLLALLVLGVPALLARALISALPGRVDEGEPPAP